MRRPDDLRHLLADVELIRKTRSRELESVATELRNLMTSVEEYLRSSETAHEWLIEAVQALAYLRNPYDVIFDEHAGLGLADDCNVINEACMRINRALTGRSAAKIKTAVSGQR